MQEVVFSCVVDVHPKFAAQLDVWLWTLMATHPISPAQIAVHLVDGCPDSLRERLQSQNIPHHTVQPFGDGKYCNKLAQLGSPLLEGAETIILCDTDIAFCTNILPRIRNTPVQAKIVDKPNPPLAMLEALFRDAGFLDFPPRARCSFSSDESFVTNCNGGLYVLSQAAFSSLRAVWQKWAMWVLERRSALGQYAIHADQISFCLSVHELSIDVDPLPSSMNCPTHLNSSDYTEAMDPPQVVHYHWNINPSGFLNPIGVEGIDNAIMGVNEIIRSERRRKFDNATFWNARYASFPEIGSGIGSRGTVLERKRKILYAALAQRHDPSILDVGCGDIEATRQLTVTQYTGIDISAEAVRICRAKRSDWNFVEGDPLTLDLMPADVVLCLDVLIHTPEIDRYKRLISRLAELTITSLIVAAYNQPPWLTSEITFYHEPISVSLKEAGFNSIEIIGGYRDTTVICATKSS